MTFFSVLALLLVQAAGDSRPLTPIEKAKAWELVRVALPGPAQQCPRDVFKNLQGEGLLVVCGGTSLDAMTPSPMVFLVIDGQAYAASIYAGAVTELPDVSMSEYIRKRASLGLFNEMEDRRDADGSVKRTFARYNYDPRPTVCSEPAETTDSAGGFVPAQRKRPEPAVVLQRRVATELAAFERRGRIIVEALGARDCSLSIDNAAIAALEDEEYEGHVRLRVHEFGKVAYEENLKATGEEIGEVADRLTKDVVKFVASNYLRLKRRGQSPR